MAQRDIYVCAGHPAVGEVAYFVAHTWGESFLDMAEAVVEWGRTQVRAGDPMI